MSKVDPYSPLRLEDFPTQREWIGTLFSQLNRTLAQMASALNGQTTLVDNIPAFTKVVSGSSLSLPLSFQVPAKFIPAQMIVAQAMKAGSPITMAGAWSVNGDTVTVNQLFEITTTGNFPLAEGPAYSITLRFM